MVFTILMFIVFAAVTAFSVRDGIWTSVIRFFNVLFAALIATTYFESLAGFLEGILPSYTYLLDYLSIWAIFSISYLLLRVLTDQASHCFVRFPGVFDRYIGLGVGFLTGFLFLSFTLFAMHTAPLQKDYWGFNSKPATPLGSFWGGFVSVVSDGSLSSGTSFGKSSDYYSRYAQRRDNLGAYIASQSGDKKSVLVNPADINEHKRK